MANVSQKTLPKNTFFYIIKYLATRYYAPTNTKMQERENKMAGKLFVFMGPHASGKMSIVADLFHLGVNLVPIYTTAKKNVHDEKASILYRYITKEEFNSHNFMLNISYQGEYYGVEKDDLFNAILMHKISATILDARATKTVKNIIKEHVETIFILSDYAHIVERMVKAGETKENIRYHLEYADINGEFTQYKIADHVVKNTFSYDKAFMQVLAIMNLLKKPPAHELNELIGIKD